MDECTIDLLFADSIPLQVLETGREVAFRHRITFEEASGAALKVLVRAADGVRYRVTACIHRLTLWTSCTCLRDQEYLRCCEHIWAALLEWEAMHPIAERLSRANTPRLEVLRDTSELPWTYEACRVPVPAGAAPTAEERLVYVLDPCRAIEVGELVLGVWYGRMDRERGEHDIGPVGGLGGFRRGVFEACDVQVYEWLCLHLWPDRRGAMRLADACVACEFPLHPTHADEILPLLAATSRLYVGDPNEPDGLERLELDPGRPWELFVTVAPAAEGEAWEVAGVLRRDDETLDAAAPSIAWSSGWIVTGSRLARLEHHGGFAWLSFFRRRGVLRVPRRHEDELLDRLWGVAGNLEVAWPDALRLREVRVPPRACARIEPCRGDPRQPPRLKVECSFEYDGTPVPAAFPRVQLARTSDRTVVVRDCALEECRRAELLAHGAAIPPEVLVERGAFPPGELELEADRLPALTRALLRAGWSVEAEGARYRAPSRCAFAVCAGEDWLDVGVEARFGTLSADMRQLLDAARDGRGYVCLSDGSRGILPETWLREYKALLLTGRLHEDRLRFGRAHLAVLDALFSGDAEVAWDASLTDARAELRRFGGAAAEEPPPGFAGALRPYQKEALGWFRFLRRFELGGCLADDMGLGKTVEVLALMEERRGDATYCGPALVVAPRSVIPNWRAEAARFAPALRVVAHVGTSRVRTDGAFTDCDVVITTYQTMVRDIALLERVRFGYAILDEAQAIKNPASARAKCARRLKARHRLALTGTPVENHIGELWSLLEFLNPGMLGSASVFGAAVAGDESGARAALTRALRPLMLRRTKREVAADLPDREEHTLYCELEGRQHAEYEKLRAHFRDAVLRAVEDRGMGRANLKVLEGLLRLRQAACHPGLIDARRRGEESAKLDLLLERIDELREEGNKALVFSQFTTFLGIVRERLDAQGIPYEYLDGQTQDRAERVARFQSDPGCGLFLISLKAGGVGLNLTAAEYVFLLDPWWNPAVEAQAIDRAHRIGQTRKVLAYRLIARDTVEERVLELQRKKQLLVAEVMQGHIGGLQDLRREDLDLLFS